MSHGEGGSTFGPLWWLVGLIIVLWVLWYVTGGALRTDKDKPFMNAPSPIGNGEVYGPGGDEVTPVNEGAQPLEQTTPASNG